ncbi:MAG: hypothetical protein JO214_05005 [Frankiaceae bacterium]|nr:hypothetical protein [Frankiaceae bacterium]
MKPPRFLFVVGVGRGPEAHPVWPDVHQQFEGELNADGSWVAWRLTGANHRELGRSPRVFPDLVHAREHAELLRDRIVDAEAHILTVPHTTTWGWRLFLEGLAVATSSRGYARHRECTYNVAAFAAAAAIAEVANGEPPRSWQMAVEPVTGPALTREI